MSPEYLMLGKFSEKSDVFSFGVLLLEIMSGRRNHLSSVKNACMELLALVSSSANILINPVVFY